RSSLPTQFSATSSSAPPRRPTHCRPSPPTSSTPTSAGIRIRSPGCCGTVAVRSMHSCPTSPGSRSSGRISASGSPSERSAIPSDSGTPPSRPRRSGSMISSFSSTISRPPSTRVPNTRTLSPMPISPRSSTRTGRRMSREVCVWSRSSTTPSSTSLRPPSSPGPWTDPRQQPAASLSHCDSGGEVEDLALDLGAGQRLIVHFVPHSGEDPCANVVVPGLTEPIGHVNGAFAVVGHRVLLTGEDEHRQLCADGRIPGSVIGLVVDVDEALHESCTHGGAEIVERIAAVVGDDVLVRSDPGGGSGPGTAPVEEAVEELIDELLR